MSGVASYRPIYGHVNDAAIVIITIRRAMAVDRRKLVSLALHAVSGPPPADAMAVDKTFLLTGLSRQSPLISSLSVYFRWPR